MANTTSPRVLFTFLFALLAFVVSAPAQSVGDSPEAVTAKLGQPMAKRANGNRETWIYSGGRKLIFQDGKLSEIGESSQLNSGGSGSSASSSSGSAGSTSSAAPQRTLNQKVSADAMVHALAEDVLLVGTTRIPMMYIVLGLAGIIALVYSGVNSLGPGHKKLGAVILGAITLLYLVVNIGAAVGVLLFLPDDIAKRLEPILAAVQLKLVVRAVIVTLELYFIWRGSGWAFGVFVLTAAIGITLDVWGAFTAQMWLLALPSVLHSSVVAAMVCAPVQGFLSRDDKSVRQVVDEMNAKKLAAQRKAAAAKK